MKRPPRRLRTCTGIPSCPARRSAPPGASPGSCGTGVAGVLSNGDGPTVLLRADMDALPVREDTGADYASTATARDADGSEVPVAHA